MSADDARVRIRVLKPEMPPLDGVQTLPTDLRRFFVIVRRVGPDTGLLLLTIRALRHRATKGEPDFRDLLWILGASPRRIRAWVERLSQAGLLVYDTTDAKDLLVLEIVDLGPPPVFGDTDVDAVTLHHDLPTHFFLHLLPRIGRTSFLYYLYLLAQESSTTAPGLMLSRAAADLGLPSEKHAIRELRRLERKKLVTSHPSGVLVLREPPPLTPFSRALLRLRARGIPPHVKTVMRLLLLAVLLLAPLFYLFFH